MSVTYSIKYTDWTDRYYEGRACFAGINCNDIEKEPDHIIYYPFKKKVLSEVTNQFEETTDPRNYYTKAHLAIHWWRCLLKLPFFSNCVLNSKVMQNGDYVPSWFSVKANIPADRMMIVLFFLRAPQQNLGVVNAFYDLTINHKVQEDIAFLMSLYIQRNRAGEYVLVEHQSEESCLLSHYAFSEKDVKEILQNEFSTNFKEENDRSKQPIFSTVKVYTRKPNRQKDSLSAYFNRKRAVKAATGNLKAKLCKAFLEQPERYESDHKLKEENIKLIEGYFKGIAA